MHHRFSTKYAWVKPLKDKKVKTVLSSFTEIVNQSKRKPNKLWVDQEKEFCNSTMQKWLDNNDMLLYLTHNKGKLVADERSIKASKGKVYKN